ESLLSVTKTLAPPAHLPATADFPATAENPARSTPPTAQETLLSARGVVVSYGPVPAVRGIDLDLHAGQIVAVMGRNGSGKSSLLWALQGTGPRSAGTVRLPATHGSPDPAELSPAEARRHVALVPQTPSHLLYHETVAAECAA